MGEMYGSQVSQNSHTLFLMRNIPMSKCSHIKVLLFFCISQVGIENTAVFRLFRLLRLNQMESKIY